VLSLCWNKSIQSTFTSELKLIWGSEGYCIINCKWAVFEFLFAKRVWFPIYDDDCLWCTFVRIFITKRMNFIKRKIKYIDIRNKSKFIALGLILYYSDMLLWTLPYWRYKIWTWTETLDFYLNRDLLTFIGNMNGSGAKILRDILRIKWLNRTQTSIYTTCYYYCLLSIWKEVLVVLSFLILKQQWFE
jgi:hypothetical protein